MMPMMPKSQYDRYTEGENSICFFVQASFWKFTPKLFRIAAKIAMHTAMIHEFSSKDDLEAEGSGAHPFTAVVFDMLVVVVD